MIRPRAIRTNNLNQLKTGTMQLTSSKRGNGHKICRFAEGRDPLTQTLSRDGERAFFSCSVGVRRGGLTVHGTGAGGATPVAEFRIAGYLMESGTGAPHSKTLRARNAPVCRIRHSPGAH